MGNPTEPPNHQSKPIRGKGERFVLFTTQTQAPCNHHKSKFVYVYKEHNHHHTESKFILVF